jgi:hypothetical protein
MSANAENALIQKWTALFLILLGIGILLIAIRGLARSTVRMNAKIYEKTAEPADYWFAILCYLFFSLLFTILGAALLYSTIG